MHLINKRRAPKKRRVRINAGLRGRVLNKRPRRLIEKIRYYEISTLFTQP